MTKHRVKVCWKTRDLVNFLEECSKVVDLEQNEKLLTMSKHKKKAVWREIREQLSPRTLPFQHRSVLISSSCLKPAANMNK